MLRPASDRLRAASAAAGLALLAVSGCAQKDVDPMVVLQGDSYSTETQEAAIQALAAQRPLSDEAKKVLRRVLLAPGQALKVRQEAFNLLLVSDRNAMREALETNIVRFDAWEARRWMLEQIGARGLKDFTTVAVNSWAAVVPAWGNDELKRPEYLALAELYGADKVPDALFAVMMEAHPIRQAGLRTRCWELLMRIGQRDRLQQLVASSTARPDDVMVRDIRRINQDLGILPETREELLWLAKLQQTATPAYWKLASEALTKVPEEQKRNFELRGVAVAIAAYKRRPELLGMTVDQLYADLRPKLESRNAGKYCPNFNGFDSGRTETLSDQRKQARWIDLVAVELALDLVDDPRVRTRLFDLADRDHQDRRTEYGGIIRLADDGSFDIVEVRPRVTGSDTRFEAPQELFDQGYTSLFHFHMHTQEFENGSYAGPHRGDFQYSNATRANCMVFSFVSRRELNADFYRHGKFVVDLGTCPRPE